VAGGGKFGFREEEGSVSEERSTGETIIEEYEIEDEPFRKRAKVLSTSPRKSLKKTAARSPTRGYSYLPKSASQCLPRIINNLSLK